MEKNKTEEMKYAEIYSQWYSWGSPVGLGLFVLFLALSAAAVIWAL
jgi:hypothetical protein